MYRPSKLQFRVCVFAVTPSDVIGPPQLVLPLASTPGTVDESLTIICAPMSLSVQQSFRFTTTTFVTLGRTVRHLQSSAVFAAAPSVTAHVVDGRKEQVLEVASQYIPVVEVQVAVPHVHGSTVFSCVPSVLLHTTAFTTGKNTSKITYTHKHTMVELPSPIHVPPLTPLLLPTNFFLPWLLKPILLFVEESFKASFCVAWYWYVE